MNTHQKSVHGEENVDKETKQLCTICGKKVKYIDHHIKAVHRDFKVCIICQQTIAGDMKKHRALCIFCQHCGYQNTKKKRLLKHIYSCQQRNGEQLEPLDLTPTKESKEANDNTAEKSPNGLKRQEDTGCPIKHVPICFL